MTGGSDAVAGGNLLLRQRRTERSEDPEPMVAVAPVPTTHSVVIPAIEPGPMALHTASR